MILFCSHFRENCYKGVKIYPMCCIYVTVFFGEPLDDFFCFGFYGGYAPAKMSHPMILRVPSHVNPLTPWYHANVINVTETLVLTCAGDITQVIRYVVVTYLKCLTQDIDSRITRESLM